MKRIFTALVMVLGLVVSAHAILYNRGTDTLGNRLIYDDDLGITWYDYTNGNNTWENQVNWASALSVTFGGTIYNDWRLPSTVDGPWVPGYDGTTTAGYNITSSEMGYLFYTELGNLGYYDTSENYVGAGNGGLKNTGDFQNLLPIRATRGASSSPTAARACNLRAAASTPLPCVPAMYPPCRNLAPCSLWAAG